MNDAPDCLGLDLAYSSAATARASSAWISKRGLPPRSVEQSSTEPPPCVSQAYSSAATARASSACSTASTGVSTSMSRCL